MGDAVADAVTEIVVAVVVSKVTTSIAEKIGLSDNMANLIGIGAAGYVGHARAQEEAHPIFGGGTGETPAAAGMDLSTGMQGAEASQAGTTAPVAPSDVAPSGPAPAAGGLSTDSGMGMVGKGPQGGGPQGGMLNESAPPPVAPPPAPKVESQLVKPPPKKPDGYWSKLFSSERTMDMLMAGIGGAYKSKEATEAREYDEGVAEKNAAGWPAAGTSGLGKMKQSFPGQGYLSQYQQ